MFLTIMFMGGFCALNPARSQETHASSVDVNDTAEPLDPLPRGQ